MHIYTTPSGKDVPSVTTILHILGSDALLHWANRMGFQHIKYEDELERTATFGTNMHILTQQLVDPNIAPQEIKYRNSMEKFRYDKAMVNFKAELSKYQYQTIFTEKTLITDDLSYAGTLDWYVYINDILYLIDFKTSKRPQMKHAFQLGGYCNLLEACGYEVPKKAGVFIVNDRLSKLFTIDSDKLTGLRNGFTKLAEIYYLLDSDKVFQ